MAQKKLVPPDGGWGWMIVLAYALNQLILVPIMQNFGLVFKDTFVELGFSATDGAILINVNAACSMLTGLINAPLLKIFGYRKVSIAGAVFTTVGVIATAYADSFVHFLVTYGLITSIGMGMGMSSYPLAMNSYFLKRRNKATGIAMTITGLGPVIMPQLISFLMSVYNVQGAMLIIGAVAAHSFIGASLLQPHKWHMKWEVIEDDDEEDKKELLEKDGKEDKVDGGKLKEALLAIEEGAEEKDISKYDKHYESSLYDKNDADMSSALSIDHDLEVQAIYGMDTPLAGSVLSLNQGVRQRLYSVSSTIDENQTINRWWSTTSIEKPSAQIYPKIDRQPISYVRSQSVPRDANKDEVDKTNNGKAINGTLLPSPDKELAKPIYDTEMAEPKKPKKSLLKRIGAHLVKMFDLNLLRDPIYVNIMIGMSLAVFAELNFSMLTPFILADFDLNTQQIATFLSVLSIADICFRFISPFVGDFLKKPPRIMYMFALVCLISSRFTLLAFSEYSHLLGVGVALGIAKGIRTVYWTLVIPAYVPIEKLAAASGIQMVVNGIFIILGGPVLGVIRDITGSYKNCIIVINCVTFITLIMWTTELSLKKYRRSKKEKEAKAIDLNSAA